MAKSRFARENVLEFALSALVALALVSCGSQTGAGSALNGQAVQVGPFCVAPLEGSPEEAAVARGHCSRHSSYSAPIEGSPEQTAVDLGR